jgi:hypothetical protein
LFIIGISQMVGLVGETVRSVFPFHLGRTDESLRQKDSFRKAQCQIPTVEENLIYRESRKLLNGISHKQGMGDGYRHR